MAASRQKVISHAEKLVGRGKLQAAIDQYRKLRRETPGDPSPLNRVGDLYARLDQVDEAVDLFGQAADHFTQEGFFLKGIAIYKKIIRLDPARVESGAKLADLQRRQGLINDARVQYQSVAKQYLNVYINMGFEDRIKYLAQLIDEFSLTGFIMHSNRSCKPYSFGQMDIMKIVQEKAGIPVLMIEADMTDARNFSESQVDTRIDAFMELLKM